MNDESLHDAGNEMGENPGVPETGAELEQLRAENENLRQTIRMRDARDAITGELISAGARSPELLFANAQNEIQFDEDGKPLNVSAVVSNLKDRFPEQFAADAPASIDAGAGRTNQNNFLTRDTLAKMKPQDIAQLDWDDVRTVLAS